MPYISSKKDLWSLVDCNNFYASCERLFRPDLINKPVVVLSNNDGCIVARSEEAKKLGIDMAVPYFKVKKLLEENKVHVFSSNYALYGNISQRVMNTLRSMVDSVEVYSIDEAFIKMDATLSLNAIDMAKTLRKRIQKWVGITTSIGIAETKTLAKLASSLAKKNQGICILKADDKNTELILKNTPAGKIWGIGSKSAEKLRLRGIYTAYQLREADRQMIRSLLSITGLHTMLELKGIPCINADQAPAPRKTLVSSRSFGKKIYEKKHLQEALALHATRAGERLRAEKLKAGGISIHLRTSRHGEKSIYNKTYAVDFTDLSDDTGHFIKSTQIALDKIFKPNFAYAKAGVMLYKLSTTGQIEKSLFDLLKNEKKIEARHKLMNAMDKINKSFGRDTLRFAAEGSDSEPWHMQRNFSSPAYTTRWEDLKEIL